MTISSNYKGFSYGKLLQVEKKLPLKIEKIEKEISNLENRSDKHSERINSIENKINEKIENKILRRIKEISCNRIDYKKRYDSGEKLNFDIQT